MQAKINHPHMPEPGRNLGSLYFSLRRKGGIERRGTSTEKKSARRRLIVKKKARLGSKIRASI